jgi:hypothetical protein
MIRLTVEFSAITWRQNQLRVPGRQFTGMPGASDITGYLTKQILFDEMKWPGGTRIECEVKTWNDKLSDEQIDFLSSARRAGCLCLVAYQDLKGIQITSFTDYLDLKGIRL